MMIRNRWTDNDVIVWAYMYLAHKDITLMSMEHSLGISHSTIWLGFKTRLECNDRELYKKVMDKLEANRHKGGRKPTNR